MTVKIAIRGWIPARPRRQNDYQEECQEEYQEQQREEQK
jgi:hypothetical protein